MLYKDENCTMIVIAKVFSAHKGYRYDSQQGQFDSHEF